MPFIILMAMPAICCICGGALVTDESKGKRTVGFILVAIGVLIIASLIVTQILNPTYYYPN